MRSKNNRPYPMIYIKPDLKFIEFVKNNNYRILITISDSNTLYDNKTIWGTVDTSSGTPNNRPNFFNQTGFYVITLDSFWYGYPQIGQEGMVTIDNIIEQPEPQPEPTPVPSIIKDSPIIQTPGLNSREIIMMFLILLAIIS